MANTSYIITPLGQVNAWGQNGLTAGLGNNSPSNSTTPVAINGGSLTNSTVILVATGMYHTLAIDSSNQLHAWGDNSYYNLGNSTTISALVPISISSFGSIVG